MLLFFDKNIGKYRYYHRYCTQNGIRAIASCTSEDLLNWDEPIDNLYNDTLGITEQYYTIAISQVPNAEHIYVSFPMRINFDRHIQNPQYDSAGISDSIFLSSRDGIHWDRSFRQAWIYPDMDKRNQTHRNYITAPKIIHINNEFNFYVNEHYCWDDSYIVRYTLPEYRFSSVYASADTGEMVIKPFVWEGGDLSINYNTSAYGFIRVAIADENAKIIDGYGFEDCGDIFGNELSYKVAWNGKSIVNLSDKPIRLLFQLNDANLYALR